MKENKLKELKNEYLKAIGDNINVITSSDFSAPYLEQHLGKLETQLKENGVNTKALLYELFPDEFPEYEIDFETLEEEKMLEERLQPIGHELVLVKSYKTLLQWFKDLSLDDKLNLYDYKIRYDSGHYIKIKGIRENHELS